MFGELSLEDVYTCADARARGSATGIGFSLWGGRAGRSKRPQAKVAEEKTSDCVILSEARISLWCKSNAQRDSSLRSE